MRENAPFSLKLERTRTSESNGIGKGMQSNTTMSIKVYLMAILDNYLFRPLLAIFRLSSSKGRNMQLSSIDIKYTLTDIVVFDCILFPIFTHTTGITHFLESNGSSNFLGDFYCVVIIRDRMKCVRHFLSQKNKPKIFVGRNNQFWKMTFTDQQIFFLSIKHSFFKW